MKPYRAFIFDSFTLDEKEGKIDFHYSLDDEVRFTETLTFPSHLPTPLGRGGSLEAVLFALHLIGGVSYYKTCCPKRIEVRSGTLTEEQVQFWNTVYEKGLGEFFFKNQIDFHNLIQFPTGNARRAPHTAHPISRTRRVLVLMGGGKDSIVTMELLRKEGYDLTLFRMNSDPLIEEIARIAGLPLINVERSIDPLLLELNAQGALNGHIPITAYLSFLSIIVAKLHGFDAIALSCERSASEGNVEYLGRTINHQWSKSEEFERLFDAYVRRFVGDHIEILNPLRAMSETEITEVFTKFPQYFRSFTSCNKHWRKWGDRSDRRFCGECPKCAFVFCLLAAYLPKKTLLAIFEKNLFEDPALIPTYRQLLGIEGTKPFECVGTPPETRNAFRRIAEQKEFDSAPVLQMFLTHSSALV